MTDQRDQAEPSASKMLIAPDADEEVARRRVRAAIRSDQAAVWALVRSARSFVREEVVVGVIASVRDVGPCSR